jgi:hypothetical protein
MYYGGESNVPGAPGNQGGLLAVNPSFDTPPGAKFKKFPSAFGSSNLPGAVGNLQGVADAEQLPAGFQSKFVS